MKLPPRGLPPHAYSHASEGGQAEHRDPWGSDGTLNILQGWRCATAHLSKLTECPHPERILLCTELWVSVTDALLCWVIHNGVGGTHVGDGSMGNFCTFLSMLL
jgi:hypothetical protein